MVGCAFERTRRLGVSQDNGEKLLGNLSSQSLCNKPAAKRYETFSKFFWLRSGSWQIMKIIAGSTAYNLVVAHGWLCVRTHTPSWSVTGQRFVLIAKFPRSFKQTLRPFSGACYWALKAFGTTCKSVVFYANSASRLLRAKSSCVSVPPFFACFCRAVCARLYFHCTATVLSVGKGAIIIAKTHTGVGRARATRLSEIVLLCRSKFCFQGRRDEERERERGLSQANGHTLFVCPLLVVFVCFRFAAKHLGIAFSLVQRVPKMRCSESVPSYIAWRKL